MSTTTTVALSQQMALERTLDVIANNLANMSTTAYKTETVVFEEYLMEVETESGTEDVSYVIDKGVNRDLKQGHQIVTNNPLDLAVNGSGYFVVETPEGDRYTRNGHFVLDDRGQLSTKEGYAVLSTSGQPIMLSPQDGEISIHQMAQFRQGPLKRAFSTLLNLTTSGSWRKKGTAFIALSNRQSSHRSYNCSRLYRTIQRHSHR